MLDGHRKQGQASALEHLTAQVGFGAEIGTCNDHDEIALKRRSRAVTATIRLGWVHALEALRRESPRSIEPQSNDSGHALPGYRRPFPMWRRPSDGKTAAVDDDSLHPHKKSALCGSRPACFTLQSVRLIDRLRDCCRLNPAGGRLSALGANPGVQQNKMTIRLRCNVSQTLHGQRPGSDVT